MHLFRAVFAGILLFIVGIALGVFALELNRHEREQFSDWLPADGTVTAVFGAGSASRALVSFPTQSGERISFTTRPGVTERLRKDDKIAVLYPPYQPTAAVVDFRAARWTRNVLLVGASVILMALGAYVAWYARGRMSNDE